MREMMALAYEQAKKAFSEGEVPVGAVLEKDGRILCRAHNLCERQKDPTAHAELLVMREGLKRLKDRSLRGCTLYVTLEPCPMCMGAAVHCGLSRLVYGASDYKFGACGGYVNLGAHSFASSLEVYGGIMEGECESILKEFFQGLRKSE